MSNANFENKFNVGGVLLNQPFKIRRLGHFGFNLIDMEDGIRFYRDLLGFRVSDVIDHAERAKGNELAGLVNTKSYFTRYGTDHHAMVLFNQRAREALGRPGQAGVTINQITWQVGSLAEVGNGIRWFRDRGVKQQRSGRDMPGSNWHTYLFDPDGHSNEIYYGIEQIGWNGHSKPRKMYHIGFDEPPPLPQISEFRETENALAQGIDLTSGYRQVEPLPERYDVDGILLPRPFKIVRLGPVYLFVKDLELASAFYRDTLGFHLTEEAAWRGQRCLFFRCNTEHHSLALFPLALRDILGMSPHSTSAALGLQLANYRQLRDAVKFFQEQGCKVSEAVPLELHPGVDHAVHLFDPDGHCIQIYCAMEQVGWDGKPRPKELRRPRPMSEWPETLDESTDAYAGEPFLGPWG
jgi:catechol 2,3-dioxygenase-like lactoylglutathione lyase family enzyme